LSSSRFIPQPEAAQLGRCCRWGFWRRAKSFARHNDKQPVRCVLKQLVRCVLKQPVGRVLKQPSAIHDGIHDSIPSCGESWLDCRSEVQE
jgi:hypothetical protein